MEQKKIYEIFMGYILLRVAKRRGQVKKLFCQLCKQHAYGLGYFCFVCNSLYPDILRSISPDANKTWLLNIKRNRIRRLEKIYYKYVSTEPCIVLGPWVPLPRPVWFDVLNLPVDPQSTSILTRKSVDDSLTFVVLPVSKDIRMELFLRYIESAGVQYTGKIVDRFIFGDVMM